MNKVIFFTVLILSISIVPAFGQEIIGQRITLSTDNTAYQQGDIITVSGTIEKVLPDTPVILQIFFVKTQVDVAQIDVSKNGKFSTTFVADGPMWSKDGVGIIRLGYGSTVSEISFEFFKTARDNVFISNFEVNIPDSGTFDIPFTMKGGTVESISINQNNLGLDIRLNTSSDGYIKLQIDRDDLDSLKNNGSDEEFIVLIFNSKNADPIQTEFRELEVTDQFRTIEIPFQNGDTDIQIIGTFVIPEFGTIAALVLLVAIVSIIAITAKSRLGMNFRY
jgi:predicted secreted protein with PEFG-CTERM motif